MKTRAEIKVMTPNQLVSWFMIAGYAYYVLGDRVMEDPDFDFLVERLKEKIDDSEHPHRSLIKDSHLKATTAYDINYPLIAQCCAWQYLRGEA